MRTAFLRAGIMAAFSLMLVAGCGKTPEPQPEPEKEKTKRDFTNPELDPNPIVDYTKWSIHDGKFWLDDKWVFIKAAKPLVNYGTDWGCKQVKDVLEILRRKYYNAIELNCYWHYFDFNGDGEIDVSLEPLADLINTIYNMGMYPCLSVETYSVGGGTIPEPFWERYPDAFAMDQDGKKVSDEEYGFGTKVVSIFHEGYRETVHKYIKNLVSGLPHEKILYYETTVEPQYMGTVNLCYSEAARTEYNKWRKANGITDAASEMPAVPVPMEFVRNETWNKFRAQFLAKWVNEDAAAYRSVAGPKAHVAMDYLDASEATMRSRDGNPEEFLRALTGPDIIQVNWHWHLTEGQPNQKAYDRVWKIKNETGRDWAITEHMTFNGEDYTANSEQKLDAILMNTLNQGTRFGWEFTNSLNSTDDSFCLYFDGWTPKRVIKNVDDNWAYWLYQVEKIEKEKNCK